MYRSVYPILLAGLAVVSMTSKVDSAIALEKRQSVNLSTGGSSDTPTSTFVTSIAPSTTTAVSVSEVTSEGSVIDESSTVVVSPTSSVLVSVSEITSTFTPTNSQGSATAAPSTVTSQSSASYSVSFSDFTTSSTRQIVTQYTVVSNGQTITASRTDSTVVPVTTSAAVTGSLLASSGNGSSSGLSSSSKKIIGGVVGGVGGALLLGALGFTAWRIWGKKKTLHDDDLYDPNSHPEKLKDSSDTNTPFRSTLDQYHQPGPVNTASNF